MKAARWHLSIIAATLTTLMLVPSAGQTATEKAQKVSSPVARKITEQPQEIAIQLKQFSAPMTTGGSKFPQEYNQASPLQAGDNIATATVIPSLPFTGTGTTVGYTDDYDEPCDQWAQSPDVVYSYTPTVDEPINISLCNSSFMTHLWVYENDSTNLFACNRFDISCSGTPRSALFELPFTAGNTYYIVIDAEGIGTAGDYEINMEVNVPPVSLSLHPAFGDAGNGNLVFAYESHDDNALYWTGSSDDGQTLTPSVYWSFAEMPTYPSVEYWGDDSVFYGTFTSPHQSADPTASASYLLKIGNPANTESYDLSYWTWSDFGWHDLKMADIACNDGLEDWNWGIISLIHSSTYGTDPLVDAPHIGYQVDSTGQATLSWYTGVNGCATTDAYIDRSTYKAYSVYDVYDEDLSQWVMMLRVDRTDNWEIDADAWIFSVGAANEHVQHPKVIANNGTLIILTEYVDENIGEDYDILIWRSTDPNLETLGSEILVGSADAERFPTIAYLGGQDYIISFVRNDSLLFLHSSDDGATWTDPFPISPPGQVVFGEYQFSTIADGKLMWQYQFPGTEDVLLMWSQIDYEDTDADGVFNSRDNCPTIYNPDQEDFNGDYVGDACCCLGMRGNANADFEEKVNIGDITYLLDYLFGIPLGPAPFCQAEGNANGDAEEKTNIGDVTYLVEYLFGTPLGPAPQPCPTY